VLSFFFFLCCILFFFFFFFFSSRRRHTRCLSDWSSDVCSSDLPFSRARASYRIERNSRSRCAARRRAFSACSRSRLSKLCPIQRQAAGGEFTASWMG